MGHRLKANDIIWDETEGEITDQVFNPLKTEPAWAGFYGKCMI